MKNQPPGSVPTSIQKAAAHWLVRRRDGLPPEAEREYQAWVNADPRHAAAMHDLHAAWAAVNYPVAARRGREAARILDGWAAARQRRRFRLVAATSLAAAAALTFAFLPQNPAPKVGPRTAAMIPRPHLETLPDGSTVELNADSEIAVNFSPERRTVRLVRGEAFFSVAKNAARPFVVSVQGVEVRAVGTAFAVRRERQQVGVLVTEGRVAVEPAAPTSAAPRDLPRPAQPIYLDAGRRIAVALDHTGEASPAAAPISPGEVDAALAWRTRRVEFSRLPLAEVAALFNARNRVQLSVADHAAAALPISGIYWSDDPEGFVRLLESGLMVRSERAVGAIILHQR